jgi:acyl transferase domain-containing protein
MDNKPERPTERTGADAIAIIGIGCRFPGRANDPEAYWRLLRDGIDAISEVPANRWDGNALYDPDIAIPGKMNTRWGGFLEGIDQFDPGFFGISPAEAGRIDPQQRVVLEVAWEALEDAGQALRSLAGSPTGVFIGVHSYDYSILQLSDVDSIIAHTSTGTSHSIVANRLSYALDLRGPSVAVDTACSSSLVATHLACQSLRNNECDLALAGGVNLVLTPVLSIAFSKLHMMAADGRCKSFDARADGFVRGEGCGIVALKRLSDALSAGDSILALIRGSAVNQDGSTNGLTAPNGLSQSALVHQALDRAGVLPSQISYVESHGTGTALGDPIEVEALASVVGPPCPDGQPCVIGSVKTNIGHLESAAGIAGLIKVVLSMQHGAIPPNLHFTKLNPHISLENTRFIFPTELRPWPSAAGRRYAGISSFGFGGTNAHMILEEAPRSTSVGPMRESPARGRACLLPLSARSAEALHALAGSYLHLFSAESSEHVAPIDDVCYTASVWRSHHEHRLALVGHSREDLAAKLKSFRDGDARPGMSSGRLSQDRELKLAFVFSGQGSQRFDMGRELMRHESRFRQTLEECDEIFRPHAGWSLLEELGKEESQSRLDQTEVSQPAIFAIQIALAALWRSWGIQPFAVVGHSVGEVAAAYVANILSLQDAVRIIFHRGRLMQQATGQGKMLAAGLSREEADRVRASYKESLSIAAFNSPTSLLFSGD